MHSEVELGWGPHLMLDCFGCPAEKLESLEYIYDLLDSFPEQIKMTKVMPPYVFKYQGKIEGHGGISGVVLLAESHISIHTFPENNHVFIDIFTGKEFNTDSASEHLVNYFGAHNHEMVLLNRGVRTTKPLSSHDQADVGSLVNR